jgi:hypothetical protein
MSVKNLVNHHLDMELGKVYLLITYYHYLKCPLNIIIDWCENVEASTNQFH